MRTTERDLINEIHEFVRMANPVAGFNAIAHLMRQFVRVRRIALQSAHTNVVVENDCEHDALLRDAELSAYNNNPHYWKPTHSASVGDVITDILATLHCGGFILVRAAQK